MAIVSLNVFPCLFLNYARDVRGVSAIFSSKFTKRKTGNSICANRTNDVWIELCVYVFYTFTSASWLFSLRSFVLAIFRIHINSVLALCAKPQMVWINTSRIIARMANTQPWGNFSLVDHPRHTVGALVLSGKTETPIALSVLCPSPYPAAIGNCDIFHKSNEHIGWFSHVISLLANNYTMTPFVCTDRR